jgi:hypothetical protein
LHLADISRCDTSISPILSTSEAFFPSIQSYITWLFYHQKTQMADPFSVTAGVIGIVVPALHGVRLLLEDLQQLRDASKTVKRLTENVQAVDTALQLLKGVEEREWKLLGEDVAQESKVTISSCTQACNSFRANLQQWTRHSSDGKLVMQDRAKVALLKKGEINTMVEQLANCKLTINTVVSIATL